MNILVDGIPTYYEDRGEGRLIVLLHGWGADSGSFRTLAEKLAEDYRVISIDLPGFGRTKQPNDSWNVQDYANFVAQFIQKLDISDPYVLIGHSMGGRISIKAVAKSILTPTHLVLLGSHGIQDGKDSSIRRTISTIAKSVLPHKTKEKVIARVGSPDYVKTDGDMRETFKKIVGEDLQSDANKISTATLLIYGENDQDTPPEFGKKFNVLIQNSKLEIIPGAGHYVQIDAVEQVHRLIKGFIDA